MNQPDASESPPRFTAWAVAAAEKAGQTVYRSASATSAVSQKDAEAKAHEAARRRAEGAGPGPRIPHVDDRYPYPERVVVEPVLDRIVAADHEIGRLTRNGYGATVLNAYAVMFVDVDTEKDTSNAPAETLVDAGQAIAALGDLCARRHELAFRVYQTRAGLRYLCTSRLFDPASSEASEILAALHSDRRYRVLCRVQRCFRARLTPKPWRCRLPLAAQPKRGIFTRLTGGMGSGGLTNPDYFATCRFLQAVGTDIPVDATARVIWELHDRLTEAVSTKPLA